MPKGVGNLGKNGLAVLNCRTSYGKLFSFNQYARSHYKEEKVSLA